MSNVILRCSEVSQCPTIKDFYFLNGNGKENVYNFLPTTLLLLYAWFYAGFYSCVSKIGSAGPDSIGSHYNYQDHDGQVTLFSGIQLWTVPRNGDYRIEAIGTSGGYGENSIIKTGGRGARVIGNFNLTKGH